MNAPTLLAELTRSGIRLERRGDKLHVQPPPGTDIPALRQKLAGHKAELLAMLKREPLPLPAGVACAYTRLGRTLAKTPGMTFACEVLPDKGDDYVLTAVGVNGAGYAVLRLPRKKFDGFKLIEMVYRWNHEVCPK